MAGTPSCYASLNACTLRVSKLGSGGAVTVGSGNGYISDALVSLQVSVEIETGTEVTQKNGCGSLVVSFKDPDKIKRLNLTMNLCQLDSTLISFLTGATLYSSGGNAIGWQYPAIDADASNGVCLEVWTKAWDGGAQAVAPFTSPDATYFHWVFPKTTWTLGNVTMEEAVMIIPVTGQGSENPLMQGDGPFNDWPTAVDTAGGVTSIGGVFMDDNLPGAICASVATLGAS